MKGWIKDRGLVFGQIGGYGAGGLTFFGIAKDALGFIGILCGAILSAWAVYDRIQKYKADKAEAQKKHL